MDRQAKTLISTACVPRRLYGVLFVVGVAAFGLSLAVGIAHAFRVDHGLPSIHFHSHLRAAVQHDRRGELRQAQAEYRAAANIDPTDFRAVDGHGRALAEQGDLAGALNVYMRGCATRPLDPRPHAGVGITLLRLGRPAEAVSSLALAIRLNLGRWDVRVALGDALRETGRLPEAEEAYRQCLLARPGEAMLFNKLGIALAHQGKGVEAGAAFREALRLQPGYAEAATNLDRLGHGASQADGG